MRSKAKVTIETKIVEAGSPDFDENGVNKNFNPRLPCSIRNPSTQSALDDYRRALARNR